jgi:hypothetical protein
MTPQRKIVDFAKSSANNFHVRVVRAFRKRDWQTLISPYYLDATTNRAREIDLVAERSWNFSESFRQQSRRLNMKLLVECKYIAQEAVFWFDQRDSEATYGWLQANTPLPGRVNLSTNRHHYLSSASVAKLFGSAGREIEREAIYKALNQSLHAMVYLRGKGSILKEEQGARGPDKALELPVIMVNSFEKFFRIDIDSPDELKPIDANFQLEVNYAYLGSDRQERNEYFVIDVVALDKLDEFLSALNADASAMEQFM